MISVNIILGRVAKSNKTKQKVIILIITVVI